MAILVRFGLVIQLKVRNPVGDGVVIELFGTTRSVMDAVGDASSNFVSPPFSFFFCPFSFFTKTCNVQSSKFHWRAVARRIIQHFAARNTCGEIVCIICKVFELRRRPGRVINKFCAILNILHTAISRETSRTYGG